jgi:hypothetical protein
MRRLALAAAVWLAAAVIASAADVVILRGGVRIDLKQPWVQQGNNAILTRTDGTLLSVPISEIDMKATAAAKRVPTAKAAPAVDAPPETPADAARAGRDTPKARVKITDSDVGHAAPVDGEAKDGEASVTTSHLEAVDITQERSAGNLIVRGNLRNVGTLQASKATLMVAVLDDKGKVIGSTSATLAGSTIESGTSVPFSGMVPVGDRVVSNVRFTPLWNEPSPPPPAGGPAGTGAAAAAGSVAAAGGPPKGPPPPAPTPYGRGSLYAAPAPQASGTAPKDGNMGYIPGATRPEDQPKPLDQ